MPVSAEIKSAFERRVVVVTASVRAARWLHREYALEQRELGRSTWDTPAIEDWDSWLKGLWSEYALAMASAPLLLSSLQERRVWTKVLNHDAAPLVSPSGLAALAESACALLSDYEAGGERRREWGKTDAEHFRQWAAAFDRECARQSWTSRAGLEQRVAQRVASALDAATLPDEILLIGFDRLTPSQKLLLNALAERNVNVRVAEAAPSGANVEYRRAPGLREELTACAEWARSQVEANPDTRIGVLVPDLEAVRPEMERTFRRVLAPQSDDIFTSGAAPFEFSLGLPLAQVPVIRAALLVLRWIHGALPEEEATWLLLSGFIGESAGEYLPLARLDAARRDSASISPEVSLPGILRAEDVRASSTLRALASAYTMAQRDHLANVAQSPGWWVDQIQALLHNAGWPGAAAGDSLSFQAIRRWERALDEIALLDFDGSRIDLGEFLHTLESFALETIFAPESEGAPVQIMGALEASGQQFDALWFLGADEASWPPRGRPHPLLPNEVQRRYGMPYANPQNDLELAKAVTERIMASAPAVVFSRAERNRDGELRPSPLLPHDAAWQTVDGARAEHPHPELETVEEPTQVAAWPPDQSPGGSETLKSQAACPFQAFAAKRLRAEPLSRAEWGLTPAERGSLLHKALENIWSPEKGSLHTLGDLKAAIAQGKLSEILRAAVESAFAKYDAVEDSWLRAYLDSEKERLCLRLEEWMQVEARRQPFEVIACEERLDSVNVGGLHLHLRADRIDQLPNFDRLLLDYKTSEVTVKSWDVPRPDEPQLPLYAVFGGVDDVQGALFAQIRAGETKFVGKVADAKTQIDANLTGSAALVKNPYTDATRDAWSDALLQLAEEFLRGEASVSPKHGADTCKYCSFSGLCRVAETGSAMDDDEELRVDDGDDEPAS